MEDGKVETFSRGSKRLGSVFGTQELKESIVHIGITPYNFVVASDHRRHFIDFDVDALFGGNPSQVMSPGLCGVKSHLPKHCRKYVEAVAQYLTEHKVFEQATRKQTKTDAHGSTPQLARAWERIDRDLLMACLHSERLTRCHGRPAWSPKLFIMH